MVRPFFFMDAIASERREARKADKYDFRSGLDRLSRIWYIKNCMLMKKRGVS